MRRSTAFLRWQVRRKSRCRNPRTTIALERARLLGNGALADLAVRELQAAVEGRGRELGSSRDGEGLPGHWAL